MNQQIETNDTDKCLEKFTDDLQKINVKIAKLKKNKSKLEADIIEAIGHEHQGQKTYQVGHMGVTIKTTCNYTLDKVAYLSGDIQLPDEYNPITEETSYKINKKMVEELLATAPKLICRKLAGLIIKKPATPSITIKPLS